MSDAEFEGHMEASIPEAAVSVDIPCLISCIAALVDCTESTIPLVAELRERTQPSVATVLENQCRSLTDLATELKSILNSYALQLESSGSDDDSPPPVDPSIGDWVGETLAAVSELADQATEMLEGGMEEQEDEGGGFVDIRSADQVVKRLIPLSKNLVRKTAFLREFLPIFKCDLDEYLAKNIAQPNRSGNINTIRSALYDLKDELRASLPFLEELESEDAAVTESIAHSKEMRHRSSMSTASATSQASEASSTISLTRRSADPDDFYLVDDMASLAATAKSVRETQIRVVESISELLTNHPSDWLNEMSAQRRGTSLTWMGFQQLDCCRIKVLVKAYRSLNLKLQIITLRDGSEGENRRRVLEKLRRAQREICDMVRLDLDGGVEEDADLAIL